MTSPPLRLPRAAYVGILMLDLRNFTEPSPNAKLPPPGCMLLKPFSAAPKRQPSTGPCQLKAQDGSEAAMVLEFQLMGIGRPGAATVLIPEVAVRRLNREDFAGHDRIAGAVGDA